MRISDFLSPEPDSLLDVGCNVGAWLDECRRRCSRTKLVGIDINSAAIVAARERLRDIEVREASADAIPFADRTFQCVTCLEVLEHLAPSRRQQALREMWRVLRPNGRLVVTVPHAGWAAWLDSNNFRFRFPRLYQRYVQGGRRDRVYVESDRAVEWHHHFTAAELLRLAGDRWTVIAIQYGGFILFPLMDWLSWPFYRTGRSDHRIRQLLDRVAQWDYRVNYGRASYGMLLVLERSSS
jgi:SAM-dependent methyltransferase